MIKHLKQSSLDKEYLNICKYNAVPIRVNFSNVLVNKPWGSEYLFYADRNVEVWHLSIKHKLATSMHCHPKKKTALVVIEGEAIFSSLNESVELKPFDAVVIEKGTFHSTQSLSRNGTKILEFETPPMKHDLVRLEDRYGRIGKGYEGLNNMVVDKTCIRIGNSSEKEKRNKINNLELCIIDDFSKIKKINLDKNSLGVIINGKFSDDNGTFYSICDIVKVNELKNNTISNPFSIFCIKCF